MGARLEGIRWPDSGSFWMGTTGVLLALAVGVCAAKFGYLTLVPLVGLAVTLLASGAWSRARSNFASLDHANLRPNLALIALPTVIATSNIRAAIAFGLLIIIGILVFWATEPIGLQLTLGSIIIPLASLTIILRPNFTPLTAVALYLIPCVVIGRAVCLSATKSDALASLIDGVGLFLVVSVVLRFAGFVGSIDRTTGLDNTLTGGLRVIFPLSKSLATTPAMAAAYVVAAIPLLIVSGKFRLLRSIALACAFYVLVLSEVRAAMFVALVLVVCVVLVPRAVRTVAPAFVGLAFAVPFVFNFLATATNSVMSTISSYAQWVSRRGEQLDTLSGRSDIWEKSIDFYVNRIDWLHQMVGYGTFGQAKSGASAAYAQGLSEGFGDKQLLTPHSSTLQLLFNGGWIVTGVIVITSFFAAQALARGRSPIHLAGLSIIVALTMAGISEVALTPAYSQPTWWIFLTVCVIAFAREPINGESGVKASVPSDANSPAPVKSTSPSLLMVDGR